MFWMKCFHVNAEIRPQFPDVLDFGVLVTMLLMGLTSRLILFDIYFKFLRNSGGTVLLTHLRKSQSYTLIIYPNNS